MLAFLLAQAAALSLSQVRDLPPAEAGDAVLRGQQHGPIATFEVPVGGMGPPGTVDAQFVEQPVASGAGCVRRRWSVAFRAAPGANIGTATVNGQYSTWEIAPSPDHGCPSDHYVRLNPGVSVERGWTALARLKAVSAGTERLGFQCSDSTSSGLCRDSQTISSALRKLTPWLITLESGDLVVLLGVPGQVVTKVRFQSGDPAAVLVTRKVPAPF